MKSSTGLGLSYGENGVISNGAIGYVDSDYASCLDSRKLITGYVFTLFRGFVIWKSNLQYVVALSSTEVEYIAVIEAVKEA